MFRSPEDSYINFSLPCNTEEHGKYLNTCPSGMLQNPTNSKGICTFMKCDDVARNKGLCAFRLGIDFVHGRRMAGAWHKYKRKRKGRWNTGEKEDIQKQALRAWLKTRTAQKGIFFVHGTYRTTVGCSLNSRSGQYPSVHPTHSNPFHPFVHASPWALAPYTWPMI